MPGPRLRGVWETPPPARHLESPRPPIHTDLRARAGIQEISSRPARISPSC
jgi:hypothetical protein